MRLWVLEEAPEDDYAWAEIDEHPGPEEAWCPSMRALRGRLVPGAVTPDFLPNDEFLNIVSRGLLRVLVHLSGPYIKARALELRDGPAVRDDYVAVYWTGATAVLDLGASGVEFAVPGDTSSVWMVLRRIVFVPGTVPNRPLFGVRDLPGVLIVDERAAELVGMHSFVGVELTPIEDYHFG
jgi:hypothetical protein